MKRKFNFKLLIIPVLIVGVVLYLFLFKLKPIKVSANPDLIPFSEAGFVDAQTLSDTNKLVSKNNTYELYVDETTSYFKVVDLRSGYVWNSNPTEPDPWEATEGKYADKFITNNAKERQKATLELKYFSKEGSLASLTNYRYSIYHPKTLLHEEGARTFQIKYLTQGFQVLYQIEDQEIDHLYFPKYIPADVFEYFSAASILESLIYQYDRDKELYYINAYETMSYLVKERLFSIFYHPDGSPKLGYTRDISIEENAKYGYFDSFEKVSFQVGMQVILTEKGFDVSVIRESIKEGRGHKIAEITLLPHLGTAVSDIGDNPTNGYLVIPDGSGAILEFNNGKEAQNPYRKRVYGEDLALLSYKQPEDQERITIPLYKIIKEDRGYAAIIKEGDAQSYIVADTSGRTDSYNKIYPVFQIRENELITLGTGYTTYSLNLWTQNIINTDLTVSYRLLTGADNNYVGIANAYRDYLTEEFGFKQIDQTTEPVVTAEFLGAYDQRSFFLGVPYNQVKSLTTFKQAEEIVDILREKDIALNVVYRGVLNGGLKSSIQTQAKVERVLGGKKGYQRLEKYLEELNVPLYLQIDVTLANSYRRFFDQYSYTASRLNGSHAKAFEYHLPTGLPYSETMYPHSDDNFVINPLYYEAIYNKLDQKLPGKNIAPNNLGSYLAGNYKKGKQIYKDDALRIQHNLLSKIERKILLSNPLGVAISYADYIVDLPTDTTLYSIIDGHIPLIQLVLSGYVDYSANSINLSTTRSVKHNFLRVLETGSNLKYTLTYDNPKKLINTDYNVFLATFYEDWLETIESHVDQLKTLKLHEGRLINHERVSKDVYKVTYSNGLELYINYGLNDVTVAGLLVKSVDYKVIKEA